MNFLRSILAEDSDTSDSEDLHQLADDSIPLAEPQEDRNTSVNSEDGSDNAWNFGGLIKNIAARSESVIETYRKDLQEFGLGLKKETEIIREVTSRAVKDLPVSLEAGASAAHGVLDGVLKSTAEIISRESQIFGDDGDPETPGANRSFSTRYSWFEAQLGAVQNDLNTFCEEPDDADEYGKWKISFQLEDKRDEIDHMIAESGTLEGMYKKVVPSEVDRETFWCRYFYRVDKLKQQERIRANLVKRAMSGDDEDEFTWDVDEEEDEILGAKEESNVRTKETDRHGDRGVLNESSNLVEKEENSNDKLYHEKEGSNNIADVNDTDEDPVSSEKASEHISHDGESDIKVVAAYENTSRDAVIYEKEEKSDELISEKGDDKTADEKRVVGGEDSDKIGEEKSDEILKNEEAIIKEKNNESASIEKVKPLFKVDLHDHGEDDLSWDDIEDVGSDEERKPSGASYDSRPDRSAVGKQLTSTEDDEELSWDIEDDDQPMRS